MTGWLSARPAPPGAFAGGAVMRPRAAIRHSLLFGGIGFGLLAVVFLVTLSSLSPSGQLPQGPSVPTPTDLPLPAQSSPPPPQSTRLPPTLPPWMPTIAAGVPMLPAPVPTDAVLWTRSPFCIASDLFPPPC